MSQANQRVQLEIPKRSYRDILGQEIDAAWTELKRPDAGLFLSGVSAGMDVGFSLLVMAVTLTLADGSLAPLAQKLLLAGMYSVGFVFVNLGRSELFTEHTTLMMFPVLNGGVTLRALGRVWLWVYAGNLLGAAAFALLAARFAPILGIVDVRTLGQIAHGLTGSSWWVTIVSAAMAGWLMGLLSWLVAATHDTMSQILCVGLIAATIGFASLHHCIAGSVEVLAGVFAGQGVSMADYGRFLLWATLGNILGGAIFASLKYSHATQTDR